MQQPFHLHSRKSGRRRPENPSEGPGRGWIGIRVVGLSQEGRMKALPPPPLPAMVGSEAAAKAPASSSSSVEASAALCEHVQRQGLQCHLFSDITLSFCGKEYQLHRIILSQSSYFHSLLSGPWREHGKSRIELQIDDPNVTAEGLEIAFSYMYGVSPVFTGGNVIAVLAAGCFLCLENLCDKCVQFIVEDLEVETFVGYQQVSDRHCYGRFADAIRNACWTFLCTHASGDLLHILPKFPLQVFLVLSLFLCPCGSRGLENSFIFSLAFS